MSEFTVDFNDKTVAYKQLLNDFKTLIRKNNLKFTHQTELIIHTLYNSDDHLTPQPLHHLIQDKFPDLNIGIATVYRTLSLLEESKMVASLSFGAQGKKYELEAKEHHDHIICTACGNITEFVDMQIEERQHHIANDLGFKMLDHSMQIYGICKTCQNK